MPCSSFFVSPPCHLGVMSEIRGLPAAIAERLRTGALIQVGNEIMPRADALRRFGDSVLAVPPGGQQVKRSTVEGDRDELVKPGAVAFKPTGKIRFPKTLEPHVVAAYDRAYAALLIPGKPISSVNQVKWRHWTHHLRRRRAAADLLDLASWVVPMGGQIPVHHQEQRVEIAIVKFGGRRWDRANFVAACKELVDELVARHLIRDDTETWLEDAYYQVPGGVVGRVEVLFLRPMLAKTG